MTLTVEVNHVTQRFGDLTALDDLSFTLPGEKIYGLLGRNGSGKSTLLSIMAAFRKATEGSVTINGEPVYENPRLTRQIALIRESGDTIEGSERVDAALGFASCMRPNWDAGYADELVRKFGLPKDQKIDRLSRGQRSTLGIILGLASRAPLTMFDESYLGLDAPSRYIFYDEILADYIRHPRIIVISTHLIEEVSSLFEEVLIIDRGKLMLKEETEQLLVRGASITGPATAVDQFIEGFTVLNSRQLGPTKAAMIYGALTDSHRAQAAAAGLEVGPVALQDLFVHLTQQSGEQR